MNPNLSIRLVCLVFILLAACSNNSSNNIENDSRDEMTTQTVETNLQQSKVPEKISGIPLPENFKRISSEGNNFADYLRNLSLDQNDNVVHLFNGQQKGNQSVHYGIIKMDVGKRDLQQCADAVMRLKAEHLFQQEKYDAINFLFTNGDWVDFNKYAQGYRPTINGNKVNWSKTKAEDYSYPTFRSYMNLIFSYAGTLSLTKQLEKVSNFNDMLPGDVLIIGGSPGHAVIVVDVAVHNTTGEKIYMIAQSYMPAQEIHILKNREDRKMSPWYHIPTGDQIITPEYHFTKENLMRFTAKNN